MPDIAYQLTPSDLPDRATAWRSRLLAEFRSVINDQYYQVDIDTDEPDHGEIRVSSARLGKVDIVCFHCPGEAHCVRTIGHIRADHSDVFVFWFVVQGTLRIAQYGREVTLTTDHFGLLNAGDPFRVSAYPGQEGSHETYGILVPRHMVDERLAKPANYCSVNFELNPLSRVAFNIFSSLFHESNGVEIAAVAGLAAEALRTIIGALAFANTETLTARPASISASAVMNCIDRRLGQAGLTARKVGEACRISERQVHRVFEQLDETFHSYLAGSRLRKARELLINPSLTHLQIAEVAEMVGFRSSSHFSRQYRCFHGRSPRADKARRTLCDHVRVDEVPADGEAVPYPAGA